MTAKHTFTATLPNGEILKRITARVYTHVVVTEICYADGATLFVDARWTSKSEWAQKYAAAWKHNWMKRVSQGDSIFLKPVVAAQVHQLPVSMLQCS